MSYEGYTQMLCRKGHLSLKDAYQDVPLKCHCGESIVWKHEVDQTNDGGRPAKLVAKTKEKSRKCKCCGASRVVAEATYKIPSIGVNLSPGWRQLSRALPRPRKG